MGIGNVKNLKMEFETPEKFNFDIEYNKLNIFVGTNGSGKSFINKLVWFLSTVTIYNSEIKKDPKFNNPNYAQFVLDNTFDDTKSITGNCTISFESGSETYIKIDKGEVIDFKVSIIDNGKKEGLPKYLSTSIRTFDDIKRYLLIRDTLDTLNEDLMKKMLKFYKIYECFTIESLIAKHKFIDVEYLYNSLKGTFIEKLPKIKTIGLNSDDFFFEFEDGSIKNLTSYSKGEQSIINMIIMSIC